MKTARIRYQDQVLNVEVLNDLQVKLPNGDILSEQAVECCHLQMARCLPWV